MKIILTVVLGLLALANSLAVDGLKVEERAPILVSRWTTPSPLTNFVVEVLVDGDTHYTNYLLRSSVPFIPTNSAGVTNIVTDGKRVTYSGVGDKCEFEITVKDGVLDRVFLSGPSPVLEDGLVVDQCLADMRSEGVGNECCSTNCASEWGLWVAFATTLPKVQVDLGESPVQLGELRLIADFAGGKLGFMHKPNSDVLVKDSFVLLDKKSFLVQPDWGTNWFRCRAVGSFLIPVPIK